MHGDLANRALDLISSASCAVLSIVILRYFKRKDDLAKKVDKFGKELNETRMELAHIQGELGLARRIKYAPTGDDD